MKAQVVAAVFTLIVAVAAAPAGDIGGTIIKRQGIIHVKDVEDTDEALKKRQGIIHVKDIVKDTDESLKQRQGIIHVKDVEEVPGCAECM